jgi:uncharacterized protein (DUF1015 family)
MTVAHPIAHALISTGGTGAQNYDEFADDREITEIIAGNPDSALAVEMPHFAPGATGSFTDALPSAAQALQRLVSSGSLAPASDVVAVYRINSGGQAAYGLWCMVDTDQISARADEPGSVIRNEDVFMAKVRERVALAQAIRCLLSPVLLLQTDYGGELQAALRQAAADLGTPALTDIDQAGRRHEVWLVPAGDRQSALLASAGSGELVVADGNHRTLAAQMAGLPRFLAVITTPESVVIAPYNRLVFDLPVPPAELIDSLRAAGAAVAAVPGMPAIPNSGGAVILYTRDGAWSVRLPPGNAAGADRLDHALVERALLGDALGLDAGDKRINYVGGDYPAAWLTGEVDAGRADLAVLIAPVTVDDFVSVNLRRQKMPRKSTWFTPKARAGLVAAKLD